MPRRRERRRWTPLPPLPAAVAAAARQRPDALPHAAARAAGSQELLAVVGIAVGVALLYAGGGRHDRASSGPVRAAQPRDRRQQPAPAGRARAGRLLRDVLRRRSRALPGVRARGAGPAGAGEPRRRRGGAAASVTVFGADPRIVQLARLAARRASRRPTLARQQAIAITTRDRRRARRADRRPRRASQHRGRRSHERRRRRRRPRATIGALVDTSIAIAPLDLPADARPACRARVSRVLVEAEPGQARRACARRSGGSPRTGVDVRAADYEPQLFNKAARADRARRRRSPASLSSLVGFMFAVCAMLVTAPARRALADRPARAAASRTSADREDPADRRGVLGVVGGRRSASCSGELLSRARLQRRRQLPGGRVPDRRRADRDVARASRSPLGGGAAGGGASACSRRCAASCLAPRAARRDAARPPRRSHAGAPRRGRASASARSRCWRVAVVHRRCSRRRSRSSALVALTAAIPLLVPGRARSSLVVGRLAARARSRAIDAASSWRCRSWSRRAGACARWRSRRPARSPSSARPRCTARAPTCRPGSIGVAHAYDHAADIWVSPLRAAATCSGRRRSRRRRRRTPARGARASRRVAALSRRLPRHRGQPRAGCVAPAARRAASPCPPTQILEGDGRAADARFAAGGWATLSRALAEDARRRRRRPLHAARRRVRCPARRRDHHQPRLARRRGRPQRRRLRARLGQRRRSAPTR